MILQASPPDRRKQEVRPRVYSWDSRFPYYLILTVYEYSNYLCVERLVRFCAFHPVLFSPVVEILESYGYEAWRLVKPNGYLNDSMPMKWNYATVDTCGHFLYSVTGEWLNACLTICRTKLAVHPTFARMANNISMFVRTFLRYNVDGGPIIRPTRNAITTLQAETIDTQRCGFGQRPHSLV